MLVLHSPEHGWKKCRCVTCAGEPVPELPALEVQRPQSLATSSGFTRVGRIPFDVKQAQAGKD